MGRGPLAPAAPIGGQARYPRARESGPREGGGLTSSSWTARGFKTVSEPRIRSRIQGRRTRCPDQDMAAVGGHRAARGFPLAPGPGLRAPPLVGRGSAVRWEGPVGLSHASKAPRVRTSVSCSVGNFCANSNWSEWILLCFLLTRASLSRGPE